MNIGIYLSGGKATIINTNSICRQKKISLIFECLHMCVLTKTDKKQNKMCHKLSKLAKRIYLDSQELTE